MVTLRNKIVLSKLSYTLKITKAKKQNIFKSSPCKNENSTAYKVGSSMCHFKGSVRVDLITILNCLNDSNCFGNISILKHACDVGSRLFTLRLTNRTFKKLPYSTFADPVAYCSNNCSISSDAPAINRFKNEATLSSAGRMASSRSK